MSNLFAVVRELLAGLDREETFDSDRILKLLYLVDWRATLQGVKTPSSVSWSTSGSTGLEAQASPPDSGLLNTLKEHSGTVSNGVVSDAFTRAMRPDWSLSQAEQEVVQFVIEHAGRRTWRELNELVWSTRPLVASRSGQHIDLAGVAERQFQSA